MEAKLAELKTATDALGDALAASELPGGPVVTDALDELTLPTPCFAEECQQWPVWQLLIGFDRPPSFWLLALVLLLYNACRAVLTFGVVTLRDEEERLGRSPEWNEYRFYAWPHRLVQVLGVVAVVAFLWHGYDWLTREVSLPALSAIEERGQ